jgi:cell wall assembly regulator SMI1
MPADAVLRPGASGSAIAAAERACDLVLPGAVRALLSLADGQESPFDVAGPVLFPAHEFLSLERAVRAWEGWRDVRAAYGAEMDEPITVRGHDPVARVYSHPGWWPLAEDGGGNNLMVDTAPEPGGSVGQIVVAGPDEDERRVLAPDLPSYLRLLAATDLDGPEPDAAADGTCGGTCRRCGERRGDRVDRGGCRANRGSPLGVVGRPGADRMDRGGSRANRGSPLGGRSPSRSSGPWWLPRQPWRPTRRPPRTGGRVTAARQSIMDSRTSPGGSVVCRFP